MDKTVLQPYVFFKGNCKEAMEYYKSIFGGELNMQTRGEVDPSAPDDMKDKIIHAQLDAEFVMMASDDLGASNDSRVSLSLSGHDKEQLTKWFDALGKDGEVKDPLSTKFWGDTFGMLTDKHGLNWMFNIYAKKD